MGVRFSLVDSAEFPFPVFAAARRRVISNGLDPETVK